MSYIGSTPTTQAFSPAVDIFSGNGSATVLSLSKPVLSAAQVQVVVNNVPQNPASAYSVGSQTITFTSAPSAGTNNIYVYYVSPITQAIAPSQGTVTTSSLNSTFLLPVANGGTGVSTSTGSGSVMLNTNPTITNFTETLYAIGNSSTAVTLALTNGTVQTVTMTGNCTFTMPAVGAGKSFVLIVNTGAGSYTGTFTAVKWPNGTAPTLTTTASRWDILSFFSDGTNWYGNFAQAYA